MKQKNIVGFGYQVLNDSGFGAGYGDFDLAIFSCKDGAKEHIQYLKEDCCLTDKFTIRKVKIII